MFFSLFITFSNSVLPKCIAPLEIPKIPAEYELIQYQVIINSGSHSPKNVFLSREKRGFWHCDSENSHSPRINSFPLKMPRSIHSIIDKRYSEYPPNCFLNDLTVEGTSQIHNLGLVYRKYLLSIDTNYLNDKRSQRFRIRATNDDNSLRNTISFLTGLFNDDKVDDLEIITGTKNKEIIIPDKKYCNDIKSIIKDFESSDECHDIISNAVNDFKNIFQYLNYSQDTIQSLTRTQIMSIFDFILSMHCNEQITDFNLTDEQFDKIETYYSKLSFNPFFSVSKSKIGIAASALTREILRTINMTIHNTNTIKFSLFSSDDSAIAALLSLLKHKRVIIPYASHLSIAILKKNNSYYLQIALNGKLLSSPTSEEAVFSYDDFCNYVNNYIDFCHELP